MKILIENLLSKHQERLDQIREVFSPFHEEIMDYQNKIRKPMDGSTGLDDCSFLQLLCLEKKPKKIIEIGTWVGSTTYAMAFATEDTEALIHSCDDQNSFYYSNLELAKRIQLYPNTWSSQLLDFGKQFLSDTDLVFNDATPSKEDCRKIYNIANDNFYFVTHDYYNEKLEHDKGYQAIETMKKVINENNAEYDEFIPEKEWHPDCKYSLIKGVSNNENNGCCALLKCKKTKDRL